MSIVRFKDDVEFSCGNIEIQKLAKGDLFTTDGTDVLMVSDETMPHPESGLHDIYCLQLTGSDRGMLCNLTPHYLVARVYCLSEPVYCVQAPVLVL